MKFLSWVRHSVPHPWQKFHCYCGLFVQVARHWELTLRWVFILLCNKCLLGAETHCMQNFRSLKLSYGNFAVVNFQRLFSDTKYLNGSEIFVMGAAHCATPMTKILLLLWYFCACSRTLKIQKEGRTWYCCFNKLNLHISIFYLH